MSDQTSDKTRVLAKAAEALVEAASLESGAMSPKALAANVERFDAKVDELVERVASVNSEIAGLRGEMSAIRAVQEDERRDKRLERAMTLTHVGEFHYYDEGQWKKSSALAKDVLEWFFLGYGYNLPCATLDEKDKLPGESMNASKKAFQIEIVNQIKDLINREPRVVNAGNSDNCTIYYK